MSTGLEGFSKDDQKKIHFSQDLMSSIDSIAVKNKLPGVSISFVSKDSIIDRYKFGYSNLEKKIKVDSETPFKVGSITKSFLALTIMKLNYEGKIDLNAPIKELIPEVSFTNRWENSDPVRVIHLLEHTSGFDDIHLNDLSIKDISNLPLKQALEHQKSSLICRWKPGMYNSYSSVGYTVLGYILERITGMTYEEYLNEEILYPLEMNSSSAVMNAFPYEITKGYGDNYDILPDVYMYARPAGSMFSTIEDMSGFVKMMLNYGAVGDYQVFPEDLIRKMELPQSSLASRKGMKLGYASGIISNLKNGQRWYFHNGGGPGCLASYYFSHELEEGFCVLTNTMNIDAVNKIKSLLIDELTRDSYQPSKALKKKVIEGEKTFVGYYDLKNPRVEKFAFLEDIFSGIKVYEQGNSLTVKELFASDKIFILDHDNLYRKKGENEVSVCNYTTESNKKGISIGSKYYEKSSLLKYFLIWVYIGLIFLSVILIIIDLIVSLSKNLVQLILKKRLKTKYLILKFSQVLTLAVFVIPIIFVSSQSTVELSLKTTENILFCIGGWIFLAMSLANVIYSFRDRVLNPKSAWQVFYIGSSLIILSLAITLFNLGIIGLKLWNY